MNENEPHSMTAVPPIIWRSILPALGCAMSFLSAVCLALESPPPGLPVQQPAYRIEPTGDVLATLNEAQIDLLEKLNRADRKHLPRLAQLLLPDRWDLPETAYSPLPAHSVWAARHPKALLVHQPMQVFGAYEAGRLVRWGPVSSGRATNPTPTGLYHLSWKSKGRHSTVDRRWYMPWYFNFENRRGLSFHQYALPGRPASHACIRLLERDARWLYQWGETWRLDPRTDALLQPGTPVWIIGAYDFEAPPPWLSKAQPGGRVVLPEAP